MKSHFSRAFILRYNDSVVCRLGRVSVSGEMSFGSTRGPVVGIPIQNVDPQPGI